ncbi:MAG: hypothetical protein ABR577_09190 [Pyrinomonadaceae bacterium]
MLFIESRTLDRRVDNAARLDLFDKLQERGLVPLIRSTRLSCYDLALPGTERAAEMERAVSEWTNAETDAPYTSGDVFCFEDFALFLIFGDAKDEAAQLRTGIIYTAETHEPQRKLSAFCHNVQDALAHQYKRDETLSGNDAADAEQWQARVSPVDEETTAAVARFAAAHTRDGVQLNNPDKQHAPPGETARALELLNETDARRALRRIREKQAGGSLANEPANGEFSDWATDPLINRLRETGLLRREVLVSCRKRDRALFRLPSPETLTVVMASNATCSECGTSIADEKVEELLVPTELANTLLDNGTWLTDGIRTALRKTGMAEDHIVAGAPSGEGESYIITNVCHELFLFALRDGELTSASARRVLDKQIETEAAHLFVVTTGTIHEDARLRLRDGARRRAQEGSGFELMFVEGLEQAATELDHAFERVSQRRLADELYALDRDLGMSVGYIVAARFQVRQKNVVLKSLAASPVGGLAGSLQP